MNRRKVLAGSSLALAAAGGGGYVYWSWSHSPTIPDGMTVETVYTIQTTIFEEALFTESPDPYDTRAAIVGDESIAAELLDWKHEEIDDFLAGTDFDGSYLCIVQHLRSPSWDLYLNTLERDDSDALHVETIIYNPWYEGQDDGIIGHYLILRITDDEESAPSEATVQASERTTPML